MASYNRVILLGNLTRDPELSYTPSSTPICKFGLATNRKWRDQSGEMREETCFVDCTAFGRRAETLNQYMRKGRPLLVEGRLQFSQWTNQEGQKRSKLEVVVDNFTFMGGPRADQGDQPAAASAPASAPAASAGAGYDEAPPPADMGAPPPADVDGDIPF